MKKKLRILTLLMIGLFSIITGQYAFSQNKVQMVRIAKIIVDPRQLESYKEALTEEIEASLRLEPGVLSLYAVSEKEKPNHITILEIYADSLAYQAHIQTKHFLKYKLSTKDMIESLELIETNPLIPGMKMKN